MIKTEIHKLTTYLGTYQQSCKQKLKQSREIDHEITDLIHIFLLQFTIKNWSRQLFKNSRLIIRFKILF